MPFGPCIDNLIRSGACVLLHHYASGTAYDWSGNLNHGILSANTRFTGPSGALSFLASTAVVTVADAPELRLTAGSIIAVAVRSGFRVGLGSMTFVAKRGASTNYQMYLTGGAVLALWDGGARTVAGFVGGARSVGFTFTNGVAGTGYMNGIALGVTVSPITVVPTNDAVTIGNVGNTALADPLAAVLIANRILTPTEMAQVHAELVNARWPAKQTAIAKREQGSVIGEPNLLAGYTLRPQGLLVPSHNGAFTGTLSGQAQHVNSILGDALSLGRVTGAVDLGVGNAQIDPTTDSHWVEVWARPLDVAISDAAVPIIGKGLNAAVATYRNFGIQHDSTVTTLYWRTAADAGVKVDGPAPRNALTHFLYQVDRVGNNAYLYVNGVAYGPTAITTVYAVAATNWLVGKNGSSDATGDESFGGLVCNPRIGTGVLTPAQVQARYLEGAKAIQFKTDWGYNISPANEGGVTGQVIGGDASPFCAGDAAGRWAIETDTVDGRLCKVLVCKTAGKLYVPASYFAYATPTESAFGSWNFYGYKADASVFDANIIATVATGITTGYGVKWAADESVVLYEYGVGNVIAGGTASHSVWHRFRVTRSITGLFTLYIDGVAVGTGTDVTTLTALYMVFDMDAGDKLALGSSMGGHGITKMLGVVTP